MKELALRLSTGLIFLAVVIGGIMLNPYTLGLLFYFVGVLGLMEYYTLCKVGGVHTQGTLGFITGTVLYLTIELYKLGSAPVTIISLSIPFFVAIFIYEIYRRRPDPFTNIAHTIIGIIYVMAPLALLNVFTFEEIVHDTHRIVVLGFFVILWLNDTGAYVFGRLFGRRKLFPRISPKKTWEGLMGGALAALAGAWAMSRFSQNLGLHEWFILALIIVVGATFGDLVESMLKRSLRVKDSSNLLPGHGGILDRFDGVLLASPLAFTYFMLFVH